MPMTRASNFIKVARSGECQPNVAAASGARQLARFAATLTPRALLLTFSPLKRHYRRLFVLESSVMAILQSQKTWVAKPLEVSRDWYVVDASGQTLGRMANKIAVLLMGKHKPAYTAHTDTGDFVVVTNAEKVVVTGRKNKGKMYQSFSGYPSGRKLVPFDEMQAKHPEEIVMLAVRRMLPKNKLGHQVLTKLKIYKGEKHPHGAQKPKVYAITYGRKAALAK
jgi:large subunit ribosomal protein L13